MRAVESTDGMMCPHCGALCGVRDDGLTRSHSWPLPTRQVCPGSGQNPRYAYSDRRYLWNGKPNPHVPTSSTCAFCGHQIFGGEGVWHTADGAEQCPARELIAFHEVAKHDT